MNTVLYYWLRFLNRLQDFVILLVELLLKLGVALSTAQDNHITKLKNTLDQAKANKEATQ